MPSMLQVALVGMSCLAASATGTEGLKCKADLVVIDANAAQVQQDIGLAIKNCNDNFGTSSCTNEVITSNTVIGTLNTTVVNAIPDCGDPSSACGSDIANVNKLVVESMSILKLCRHQYCSKTEGDKTDCITNLNLAETHMVNAGLYLTQAVGDC